MQKSYLKNTKTQHDKKFIIYKISDDGKNIEIETTGEKDKTYFFFSFFDFLASFSAAYAHVFTKIHSTVIFQKYHQVRRLPKTDP